MPDITVSKDVHVVDIGKLCDYYGVSDSESLKKETRTAITKLFECSHSKGGNMAQKYRTYERYVPVLLKLHFQFQDMIEKQSKQIERYEKAASARKNARWTSDEDNALVEMVAQGGIGVHELSTMFGRSPASISTRLSKLVGIGRISQDIVGRFIGTLNGEEVSGQIDGTLIKCKG
jgi:predicted HTH transcriptional regulator